MWMHGFGGMFFGWLFWLAVIGGVVALVVWAIRNPTKGPVPSCCSNNALDLLNQRYARGELNREQFEQMRKDIER